jgi:pimeloyl-ACP methyl ester carboxylesterase
LVFLGENDGLIGSPKAAAKRARNIPNCDIVIMPRAGHIMNIDQPELVGAGAVKFLTA